MVLNDLVVSFCYSQKNAGLKGLIEVPMGNVHAWPQADFYHFQFDINRRAVSLQLLSLLLVQLVLIFTLCMPLCNFITEVCYSLVVV